VLLYLITVIDLQFWFIYEERNFDWIFSWIRNIGGIIRKKKKNQKSHGKMRGYLYIHTLIPLEMSSFIVGRIVVGLSVHTKPLQAV